MAFTRSVSHRVAAVAALMLGVCFLSPVARADAKDEGIQRAHRVLKTEKSGKDVLSFVHYGAAYRGHAYTRTLGVTNRPDDFALAYRYNWEDDGWTEVAFLCDRDGSVYEVKVLRTNAQLQPPFVWAEAAIQVVGEFVLAAGGQDLKPAERDAIRRAIAAADAKALLEAYVKLRLP